MGGTCAKQLKAPQPEAAKVDVKAVERMNQAFADADKDGNGTLDLDEIMGFLVARGFKLAADGDEARLREVAEELMAKHDADKNGKIDRDEWTNMYADLKGYQMAEGRANLDDPKVSLAGPLGTAALAVADAADQATNPMKQPASKHGSLHLKPDQIRELRANFDALDLDKNGQLDKDELLEGLRGMESHGGVQVTEEKLRERVDWIMTQYDLDHNGTLDFQEYCDVCVEMEDWAINNHASTHAGLGGPLGYLMSRSMSSDKPKRVLSGNKNMSGTIDPKGLERLDAIFEEADADKNGNLDQD